MGQAPQESKATSCRSLLIFIEKTTLVVKSANLTLNITKNNKQLQAGVRHRVRPQQR